MKNKRYIKTGKIDEAKFKKYVKKPVMVEAYQTDEEVEIETLEGTMTANKGDYIIKGIQGELYPCKPDIFNQTYDIKLDGDIDLTGEVRQYHHKKKLENHKWDDRVTNIALDVIDKKIIELAGKWYDDRIDLEEQEKVNLQLCVLEEIKEEIIKTTEEVEKWVSF